MTGSASERSVQFGRFLARLQRRELLLDGRPVDVGSRAFDILEMLLEAKGQLVTKDEIMRHVWAGATVEENSLQVHISALRKALGADRDLIKTVSGRGYRWVQEPAHEVSPPPMPAGRIATNLPAAASDLIGREAAFEDIAALLNTHRIVTLAGPGGIGKTRLGVEVARRKMSHFTDGAWLVDLAPVTDPSLVPTAIAGTLELNVLGGKPSAKSVAHALAGKHMLLVLDNCEHVIGAVAEMVAALVQANPALHVLATSRETLRADGENIYTVPPLDVPAEDEIDTANILNHGAVRLFVARVHAVEPRFSIDARRAPMVSAVCRRLDGIPLAIELAAARAAALGVEGLAARLDDRFKLLTSGHRTALPRHQTLRATLDWSYDLLSDSERLVLSRLGIFVGEFTLDAAVAIIATAAFSDVRVLDCLTNLVAKSLVVRDCSEFIPRYRLLETTRAYAAEKLEQSGMWPQTARRNAAYWRDLFERAESNWTSQAAPKWPADYHPWLSNVRAAMDWALSPQGDALIAAGLTVAAVPLWEHLSLIEECRERVEQSLTALETSGNPDQRRLMQLHAAHGGSLMYARGFTPETAEAWTKARALAETQGDLKYRLSTLWGLWAYNTCLNRHRAARELAERFHSLATRAGDAADQVTGNQMFGATLFWLGDPASSRRYIEYSLKQYEAVQHRRHTYHFFVDERTTAQVYLSKLLWLQGYPDQAMRVAEDAVTKARALDHSHSLCYALVEGPSQIAFINGDFVALKCFLELSETEARRRGMALWEGRAMAYQAVLQTEEVSLGERLTRMRTAIDSMRRTQLFLFYTMFLGRLAEGLGSAGEMAAARRTIEEALTQCELDEEQWCLADLLQIKGKLVMQRGGEPQFAEAAELFERALELARQQGALSWELRTATSYAQLMCKRGRPREAEQLLAPVYGRFTEGLSSADLRAAKAQLAACS